jgi:pimeloyl-ACP methyl ester carboxylesterase
MNPISRRGVIFAGVTALAGAAGIGGAYALVEEGVLPGRYRLAPYLGKCGNMPALPDVRPGPVRQVSFASSSGPVRVVIGLPPGIERGIPVVLMLHGSGGDARTPFDVYGIHRFLADAVRTVPPFAVAAIDDWAGPDGAPSPLLTRELPAFLQTQGLATGRIGALGWSIGGRGALRFAVAQGPRRVAVVAAASPALAPSDPASLAEGLSSVPASLTCGRDDAFADPTSDLLERLRRAHRVDVTGGIFAGCHDAVFRRRMLPGQLAFLGRHLENSPPISGSRK